MDSSLFPGGHAGPDLTSPLGSVPLPNNDFGFADLRAPTRTRSTAGRGLRALGSYTHSA